MSVSESFLLDAISAANPRVIDDSRARKLSNDLKRCTYYETCSTYGLNVERVFQDGKKEYLKDVNLFQSQIRICGVFFSIKFLYISYDFIISYLKKTSFCFVFPMGKDAKYAIFQSCKIKAWDQNIRPILNQNIAFNTFCYVFYLFTCLLFVSKICSFIKVKKKKKTRCWIIFTFTASKDFMFH